jgi:hypothetical protein
MEDEPRDGGPEAGPGRTEREEVLEALLLDILGAADRLPHSDPRTTVLRPWLPKDLADALDRALEYLQEETEGPEPESAEPPPVSGEGILGFIGTAMKPE